MVRLDELFDHQPGLGINDAGHPLFDGKFVEFGREPFRGTAGIAEDDRGAIGQDALEDLGINRRPDRAA